jgi:hypothetical protein
MPYVYLIQPVELVGTNRYKIGMSSLDNLNRMKSYKNGTRHLFICEKSNALEVERKLIKAFNSKYKLIGGNEYFEVDNEQSMIELFISVAMGYAKKEESDPTPIKNWMNKFAYNTTTI